MEYDLIKEFYASYLQDLKRWIFEINEQLSFYREYRIRNMNKTGIKYENALLADAIVCNVLKEKKEYQDDSKRIVSRDQAAPRMVRWHGSNS